MTKRKPITSEIIENFAEASESNRQVVDFLYSVCRSLDRFEERRMKEQGKDQGNGKERGKDQKG